MEGSDREAARGDEEGGAALGRVGQGAGGLKRRAATVEGGRPRRGSALRGPAHSVGVLRLWQEESGRRLELEERCLDLEEKADRGLQGRYTKELRIYDETI